MINTSEWYGFQEALKHFGVLIENYEDANIDELNEDEKLEILDGCTEIEDIFVTLITKTKSELMS